MLTAAEVDRFVGDGYLPLRGAVPPAVAASCAEVLWAALTDRGISREDPATWTDPVVWLPCPEGGPFVDAGTSPALWEAYDQLIGPGRWPPRRGVGGSVPVRFPNEDDPGYASWHFDSGSPRGDKTWSSVQSPTRALLSLFLFSDVGEDDAPTLLLRGSHLDVAALLGPAGEEGLEWSSLESRLPSAAFEREVVAATGAAGDVYLCHPFLVHRASWPHRGRSPRLMAQPSVWLKEPYALTDPDAAFPVEQAILRGYPPVTSRQRVGDPAGGPSPS
jgi:hypothetical protein